MLDIDVNSDNNRIILINIMTHLEPQIGCLSDDIIEKLDKKMEELKGIGLSDIDIYIINLAISLSQKKVLT